MGAEGRRPGKPAADVGQESGRGYEPPAIERVGSLRELVGKTGTPVDNPVHVERN